MAIHVTMIPDQYRGGLGVRGTLYGREHALPGAQCSLILSEEGQFSLHFESPADMERFALEVRIVAIRLQAEYDQQHEAATQEIRICPSCKEREILDGAECCKVCVPF